MKGDQADIVVRLRLTLPEGWVADRAPLLDALLSGLGAAWAGLYELLRQVRLLSRLATVTGQFLDLACSDFFGGSLRRRVGERDEALRARFMRALWRERGTRQGLIAAASAAGYSAAVFEPAQPGDTGAYGVATGLAWNVVGGWGSLSMPFECLVTTVPVAPVDDVDGLMVETLPAGGVAWVRRSA